MPRYLGAAYLTGDKLVDASCVVQRLTGDHFTIQGPHVHGHSGFLAQAVRLSVIALAVVDAGHELEVPKHDRLGLADGGGDRTVLRNHVCLAIILGVDEQIGVARDRFLDFRPEWPDIQLLLRLSGFHELGWRG
jgi:hypothetical protein